MFVLIAYLIKNDWYFNLKNNYIFLIYLLFTCSMHLAVKDLFIHFLHLSICFIVEFKDMISISCGIFNFVLMLIHSACGSDYSIPSPLVSPL